MEATDLPALDWAQMFTSIAVLRDFAAAQDDERTLNMLLKKFGAGQFVGDTAAQQDLIRVAGCIDFQKLDGLRLAGVIEE
jgi:hypothetical protein